MFFLSQVAEYQIPIMDPHPQPPHPQTLTIEGDDGSSGQRQEELFDHGWGEAQLNEDEIQDIRAQNNNGNPSSSTGATSGSSGQESQASP